MALLIYLEYLMFGSVWNGDRINIIYIPIIGDRDVSITTNSGDWYGAVLITTSTSCDRFACGVDVLEAFVGVVVGIDVVCVAWSRDVAKIVSDVLTMKYFYDCSNELLSTRYSVAGGGGIVSSIDVGICRGGTCAVIDVLMAVLAVVEMVAVAMNVALIHNSALG